MYRKHISSKTDKASLLLQLGDIPYEHAKLMTEDQIISLYQRDHNIFFESGHPDRDKFWNLTHRLITAHRQKTRRDLRTIAKGRRIRNKANLLALGHMLAQAVDDNRASPSKAVAEAITEGFIRAVHQKRRKIPSRGFDKTLKRKWDGTVVKR